MKDFRNELLNLLINEPGFISLTSLKNKYCPNPPVFKLEEQDNFMKLRLNMNHIISELKNMGWIEATGEFGTGTGYPNIEGMRYFVFDPEVKARITTKGEIEYKKMLKEQEPPKPTFQVGDNFTGIISGGDTISSVVQDSGNKSSQKTKAKTATKTAIINKIIIGVIIGLMVLLIGHYIFGIG